MKWSVKYSSHTWYFKSKRGVIILQFHIFCYMHFLKAAQFNTFNIRKYKVRVIRFKSISGNILIKYSILSSNQVKRSYEWFTFFFFWIVIEIQNFVQVLLEKFCKNLYWIKIIWKMSFQDFIDMSLYGWLNLTIRFTRYMNKLNVSRNWI